MRCGLCGFLIIKPQTALHHVVWCGALLFAVQCGYAILGAVLVWFMWFVRFGEHPYSYASFGFESILVKHSGKTGSMEWYQNPFWSI